MQALRGFRGIPILSSADRLKCLPAYGEAVIAVAQALAHGVTRCSPGRQNECSMSAARFSEIAARMQYFCSPGVGLS